MPSLRDPQLELFAREYAAALNNGVAPSEAAVQASIEANYPRSKKATTFAANSRKRAQRADVRKRVDELRAPGVKRAEESLGITTEYLLAKLNNLVAFNLDDYLTDPAKGEPEFTLNGISRTLRSRLASARIGKVAIGRGKSRRVLSFIADVEGHDPYRGIELMAKIKGLMAPEKRDLTVHATDQVTDDELARIAAGGGARSNPAPVDP